jgi:hypothetical protein
VRRLETGQVAGWPRHDWSDSMADVIFVLLTVAFFAVTVLLVKGAERL